MKAFILQEPIKDKIKAVVDIYLAAEFPTVETRPVILYTEYEPSEGMIGAILLDTGETDKKKIDGAVCVYAPDIQFKEAEGSTTGKQDSTNIIRVDIYGFGDVFEDVPAGVYSPSLKQAQFRAEVLVQLAYNAIQDRTEMDFNSPNKGFGTGISFKQKFPKRIQKFSPQGGTEDQRGICIYRSDYEIRIEEEAPQEQLGPEYTGSTWSSGTYNPGDEPTA